MSLQYSHCICNREAEKHMDFELPWLEGGKEMKGVNDAIIC